MDTCWIINIRLLAHEEGVYAEKLRHQNGHQRAVIVAKLLQAPAERQDRQIVCRLLFKIFKHIIDKLADKNNYVPYPSVYICTHPRIFSMDKLGHKICGYNNTDYCSSLPNGLSVSGVLL